MGRMLVEVEATVQGIDLQVVADVGWDDWGEPPYVVDLREVARIDGQALGDGLLRLDLRELAVSAVVARARAGPPGPLLQPGPSDASFFTEADGWRAASRAVRAAAAEHGRLRWTPALDRFLAETWRQVLADGGSASDLAEELGTTTGRVRARLSELRKRWGDEAVPRGQPGRPSRHDGGGT